MTPVLQTVLKNPHSQGHCATTSSVSGSRGGVQIKWHPRARAVAEEEPPWLALGADHLPLKWLISQQGELVQLMPRPGFQGDLVLPRPPAQTGASALTVSWKGPLPPCPTALYNSREESLLWTGKPGACRLHCHNPGIRSSVVWALHYFLITFPPNKPSFMSGHMVWVVYVCDPFS